MAPERSSARSSVALRDRPSMRGPENPRRLRPATGRYPWLYPMYIASSLVATPKNQRKPDSASLRSFAEQRYLAGCVAPRELSLIFKPCCYSFLIQGKNTCENILQSVLQLGLLRKGAHISLVYCVHRPTDCILPGS